MRFSRVIKIIFICLIFLILLAFFLKDYIARNVVLYSLKKNFSGECSLKKINLFLENISIDDLEISRGDFDLSIKHGQLVFKFSKFLSFKILSLNLEEVNLKINDLASCKRVFLKKNNETVSKKYLFIPSFEVEPLFLDLKDIRVSIEEPNNLEVKTGIDFRGIYSKDNFPKIERLNVPECEIRKKDFEINFKILKEEDYKLKVSVLKVKDKKIKDLEIAFDIKDNTFLIKSVKSDMLGPNPGLKGRLNFKSYYDVCLEMEVKDIYFTNIVNLFNEEQGIIIKGAFNGEFNVCLDAGKLEQLNAKFYNKSGGGLDIKKDAALGFLRKYLNESSYDALVDNLKNYLYNNAGIEINKDKSKISVNLDFRSENMGRRNLMFNFHDQIGVPK